MRFADCCNISCKRIDAVEHSDDLGASRKGRNLPTSEKQSTLEKIASPLRRGSKKLQQSNAPGPKDLDALACRLAERVRPRLAKTDGGQTYVSQSVPHPELMEALQDEGLDESSAEGALVAMRDVEIMRRVATGPRAKDDLYRFNDAVLPATMRIILSTVRFPDEASKCTKTCTVTITYGDVSRELGYVRLPGDDGTDRSLAPSEGSNGLEPGVANFDLPAAVVRGASKGFPLLVEARWKDCDGKSRKASTSLTIKTMRRGQFRELYTTGGYDKHHADAVQACAKNRLRLFYEASIEGLDMDSHSGRLVPPERKLDGKGGGAFFRLFALATPGTQPTEAEVALADRKWDRATHDWSVYCRLEDVRGSKLKIEGALATLGGNYVVTVGARLREPRKRGGAEVKSSPAPKDWLEHGAEWGAGAVDNENAAGGLIVVHGAARRSTGLLRLNVYERLATDPLETYQLGHVDVPLLDVPVVRNPSAAPTQPISAGMRTLSLRRRAVITGKPSLNGQIRCAVWMQARSRESATLRRWLARWPWAAGAGIIGATYATAKAGRSYVEISAVCLILLTCALMFEGPRLLGAFLGWAIRMGVDGLNIRVEACSLRVELWPAENNDGGADFRLAVDVQNVRLVNVGNDYLQKDFVAAESVRVVVRCDRQILHRASGILAEFMRRKWVHVRDYMTRPFDADGDGDVDFHDIKLGLARIFRMKPPEPQAENQTVTCMWRLRFEKQKGVKKGDRVYLKLTTTTANPITLARTDVKVLDDDLYCMFRAVSVPLETFAKRTSSGGFVDVVAYRAMRSRADDFLGVANRLELVQHHATRGSCHYEAFMHSTAAPVDRGVEVLLKKRGASVGLASGQVNIAAVGFAERNLKENPPLVRWRAFPAQHHKLVQAAPGAPPTRLATLVVEDLRVRGATVAFGMARNEFNVCSFVRAIDEGKVRAALPRKHRSKPPNTLRVTVLEGRNLPSSSYVTLSLRRQTRTTATRRAFGEAKASVYEPHHTFEFKCPDPSAVFVASVVDAFSGSVVGRWLVTSKMMVLNSKNVYGGEPNGPAPNLTTSMTEDGGNISYTVEGPMELRGSKGKLLEGDQAKSLTLRVTYVHVPGAPTQADILRDKPMTALEQLQLNSLETNLRLGHLSLVSRMLDDFPLLLDIRSCQVAEASCYLSELFAGYEGRGETAQHKFGAARMLDALQGGPDDEDGPQTHSDHIYLPILDLKDACKFEGGLSLGHVCKTFLSPSVVSPILNRLDLSHAIAHFAGGGLFSFHSVWKSKFHGASSSTPSTFHSKKKKEETKDTSTDDKEPVRDDDGNPLVEALKSISIDDDISDDRSSTRERALAARDAAFPKTNGKLHELTFTQDAQEQMRTEPTMAGCLLRSTKAKGTEKPYHVEVHGGFLYWTKCKPDGESRAGHTRVVVLSGADVAGDPEGVRVTLPVPDGGRRSSLGAATTMATDMIAVTGATKSSQAPSTVYLRVCDRVADKRELAKKWAEALTAGAEKQQPLGGYRGEDVSAKNPFTKALAARGRLAVAS